MLCFQAWLQNSGYWKIYSHLFSSSTCKQDWVSIATGYNLMSGITWSGQDTEHWVKIKSYVAFYCTSIGDAFGLKPWIQKVGLVLGLILCKWSWSPSDYCCEGLNYPATLFCLPVQSNRMCTEEANCWEKLLLVCMTDQERSKFISDSLRQIFL